MNGLKVTNGPPFKGVVALNESKKSWTPCGGKQISESFLLGVKKPIFFFFSVGNQIFFSFFIEFDETFSFSFSELFSLFNIVQFEVI